MLAAACRDRREDGDDGEREMRTEMLAAARRRDRREDGDEAGDRDGRDASRCSSSRSERGAAAHHRDRGEDGDLVVEIERDGGQGRERRGFCDLGLKAGRAESRFGLF